MRGDVVGRVVDVRRTDANDTPCAGSSGKTTSSVSKQVGR